MCHGKKSRKKIHKFVFKAGLEKHTANESQAMLRTRKVANTIYNSVSTDILDDVGIKEFLGEKYGLRVLAFCKLMQSKAFKYS